MRLLKKALAISVKGRSRAMTLRTEETAELFVEFLNGRLQSAQVAGALGIANRNVEQRAGTCIRWAIGAGIVTLRMKDRK